VLAHDRVGHPVRLADTKLAGALPEVHDAEAGLVWQRRFFDEGGSGRPWRFRRMLGRVDEAGRPLRRGCVGEDEVIRERRDQRVAA
jgi:hypothetical protein